MARPSAFLVGLGAHDRQDRAEDLGLVDRHVLRDAVEQAAADEEAVLVALQLEKPRPSTTSSAPSSTPLST
jgi:hypothetical protein